MDHSSPSLTALRVARLRARQQIAAPAGLFIDPLAVAILGEGDPRPADLRSEDGFTRGLRLFVAARSRFAEDSLALVVARGVRQAVMLGAGLDTLSLRNPHAAAGLRIFEVDHPATQAWKRERIAAAAIGIPESARFASVDFEHQRLDEELARAGYDASAAGFFIWLGVVPYLTRAAIFSTLAFIARGSTSEVVFDYGEPIENRDDHLRAVLAERARRVARIGEPWLSSFEPADLSAELRERGFDDLEDLSSEAIAVRYFGAPPGTRNRSGMHFMRARKSG